MEDDDDGEESFWGDLYINFPIENLRDGEDLVGILDQARIDRIKIQASFQEEYQRLQFDNQLHLQQDGEEVDKLKVKTSLRRFFKRPEGYSTESVMDLGTNQIHSKIFMIVYKDQVERMQTENSYRIYSDRNKLRIFMKEGNELNTLCKHRLLQMKNQLCILHVHNQQLITLIRTSNKLKVDLQMMDIHSMFRWHRNKNIGYFYSCTQKFNQIAEKVEEVSRFNTTIFYFHHKSLTKIENISVFAIIKESISETVKILEQQYEIKIQFNSDCNSIIIHKKHACFGEEVEKILKNTINRLIIMSVKSKQIRQFNNRIKKQIKSLPFLKQKMKCSRNQTFLSVDLSQINPSGVLNAKYLQNFLKYFKIVLDTDLQINLFFNHIDANQVNKQIERIIQISQSKNFILKNDDLHANDGKQMKGIFTLKDLSESVFIKRQRQLMEFITQILIRQSNAKKQQTKSLIESFFDDSNSIPNLQKSQLGQSESSLKIYQDKGKIEWFTESFKMPPLREIPDDDKPFILNKKRRDLQDLFYKNSNIKFKIFSLQLATKIKWPKELIESPILIKRPFNGIDFNEKFQACKLNDLKENQQAFIVYLSKSIQQDFVPVLSIKRI